MDNLTVPYHLGIIPDGNRRWAKNKALKPWEGHKEGLGKFEELLGWCEEIGIKMVTIYTVSTENLSRPKEEVEFLMNILKEKLKSMLRKDSEAHKKKIRVRIVGNKLLLSKELQDLAESIERETKDYSNFYLNLAICYGGREEILNAAKKLASKVKEGELQTGEITEKTFSKELYQEMPDIDLIIRTSEQRISGFFPWHSVYSEIIFLPDKLFPDLTKEDFLKAISEFSNRQRRFGK